ncbi:MAG: carboxypeptidase-like regulatory domain-containing protein [Bacteroidota bacterium]|nr:carboxypeptidase-like regulatory domain-containing protein [Bacteroidota bacterium]
MLNVKFFLLPLILLPLIFFAQINKVNILVLDNETNTPIGSASINIKSSKFLTQCNYKGEATIETVINEKIIFSHISYVSDSIQIDSNKKSQIIIHLRKKVNDIAEVRIIGVQKRTNTKYKYKYPLNSKPATISSPISYIYEKFNKKIWEINKYNHVIENEININLIQEKILKFQSFLAIKDKNIEYLSYIILKKYPNFNELSDLEFITIVKELSLNQSN